jgi:hypothetical protein
MSHPGKLSKIEVWFFFSLFQIQTFAPLNLMRLFTVYGDWNAISSDQTANVRIDFPF